LRDERVDRWLDALVATPGLTAIEDPAEARALHVDDALAAVDLLGEGPVVDVGSGGGSPGIPLAAALPELRFDLLEANGKKCAFLRRWEPVFPNVRAVCARAEEHGRGPGREAYGTAVARALATPPVASLPAAASSSTRATERKSRPRARRSRSAAASPAWSPYPGPSGAAL
jgi:16S rRNA (guanine527-N7)-methyltransferase